MESAQNGIYTLKGSKRIREKQEKNDKIADVKIPLIILRNRGLFHLTIGKPYQP